MKENKKNQNKSILKTTYIFFGLFLLLMCYLAYFVELKAKDVINNSYNKRTEIFANKIIRGSIYSNNDEVLARTDTDDEGNETRVYPYNNLFSHVVGLDSHGKYGLELTYNFELLTSNANPIEQAVNEFKGEKNIGDNIYTTLDVKLQQAASNAMGNDKGAIIVMEPDTGKILAMVSKPDYNPNDIDKINSILSDTENTNGELVNRATQGLYTPGSTFKLFTLLEYSRENPNLEDFSYTCTGKITIDDYSIQCSHGAKHGKQSLIKAFANSCNGAFVTAGLTLDTNKMSNLCNDMLFGQSLPIDLRYKESKFSLVASDTQNTKAQTMIGQGKTVVSPIHMALIASAIANDGVLMKPYFVDRVQSYTGTIVKQYEPKEYKTILSKDEASMLQEYMAEVVNSGTAKRLKNSSYSVSGKTGTAEIDKEGNVNSWFVGFAQNDSKKVAICVVFENVNSDEMYGVNAAKKVLDSYMK